MESSEVEVRSFAEGWDVGLIFSCLFGNGYFQNIAELIAK